MTFTFTIRISQRFSSMQEFQMGNFQKYWSQNVGQDFIVLDFFHGRNILKVDGRDGRDPQNRERNAPAGRFTCMIIDEILVFPAAFEKGRLNIGKTGTPSTLGKYLGHIKWVFIWFNFILVFKLFNHVNSDSGWTRLRTIGPKIYILKILKCEKLSLVC